VLLRSGAFALVVLDGVPRLAERVAVRLARLARDAGAALVVTADDGAMAAALPVALRLRVESSARLIAITVEKGGPRRRVEVRYGVDVADRLCAHPEVGDRRGVERRGPRALVASGRDIPVGGTSMGAVGGGGRGGGAAPAPVRGPRGGGAVPDDRIVPPWRRGLERVEPGPIARRAGRRDPSRSAAACGVG
jgi:hypothetical protein